MKTRLLALTLGLLLIGAQVFAGDGDLIVNGKVGVGTANPQAPLHIQSPPSGESIRIYGRNNGGVDEASVGIFKYSGPSHGWIVGRDGRLDIHSGDTRTMTLSNGNVGIGTIVPANKLDVYMAADTFTRFGAPLANSGQYTGLLFGYGDQVNTGLYTKGGIAFNPKNAVTPN